MTQDRYTIKVISDVPIAKDTPTNEMPNAILYDKNWIPPINYPLPPKETLTAIQNNIIYEPDLDAKGRPSRNKINKVLLTAVANSGMLEYALNWIASLKQTGQDDRFLVFAIDQGIVDELTLKGYGKQVTLIPDDWFHVPLASDFAQWKSNDYRPITHVKSLIVERLLYLDITVWFTDVDIIFQSSYIRQTMILLMSERPNTHMLFSQEVDQRTINSGFYMMKPTNTTKQFMQAVVKQQDMPNTLTQQKVMNNILRSMFNRDLAKGPYRLLDMLLFPNGKYYFRMNLPLKLGINPLMVHANYLIGDKKKEALSDSNLWYSDV